MNPSSLMDRDVIANINEAGICTAILYFPFHNFNFITLCYIKQMHVGNTFETFILLFIMHII